MTHSLINMPNPQTNVSWLWLTYSQVPDCPPHNDWVVAIGNLEFVSNKHFLHTLCIEQHADGGRHVHCLVHFPDRIRFRSSPNTHIADKWVLFGRRPNAKILGQKTTGEKEYIKNCHEYCHKEDEVREAIVYL